MERFAFMIHPLDIGDVSRKFGFAKWLPESWIESLLKYAPPLIASEITGVKSEYAETAGWFVACPLTTSQIRELDPEFVLKKVIATGKKAEQMGAKILGLGAFTKIVGDAGVTVDKALNIPVTTGNSYTVASALEGVQEASKLMGYNLEEAEATVVGARGAIGAVCARILAPKVRGLNLVGRDQLKLEELGREIEADSGLKPQVAGDLKAALLKADIVITVTSAEEAIIEPEYLKPGAIVCDVARPRDVSQRVVEMRDDVLVIEGGVVEIPGEVNFNFDFGFPPGMAYACMAETMILALEKRFESFTLGRDLSVEQVQEISALASKHGFKLAGFRSFEKPIAPEDIARIAANARKRLDKA